MNITESIKFDKLQEENEILKKELAEKDRKIDLLLTANKQITYSTKSREYNQQKLYKEDFKISEFCINCGAGLFYTEYYQKIKKGRKINLSTKKCSYCGSDRIIKLKDNSKYDKLPSKDVK
ncbi:hypothetical protein [Spiroplasma poulsonii]|uniref:hypothetical protein n=1 Tax=Spiroplasma poulsonii TaxID=2138 RepID=UPI001F4CD5AE|nr:hypothetical protein [Spiroplasma poulsonii]UNF62654.1 hypothetical protein MNU24_04180 [Spiroplasma poulsonii]